MTNFERYAILRQTNGCVHGYIALKKLRCGHRKISRLSTPLSIYRVGLRGKNVHKSTRKHRFRQPQDLTMLYLSICREFFRLIYDSIQN